MFGVKDINKTSKFGLRHIHKTNSVIFPPRGLRIVEERFKSEELKELLKPLTVNCIPLQVGPHFAQLLQGLV